MSNKIPNRDQIATEHTWNLSDMFASETEWLEEYEKLKNLPEKILSYSGKLGADAYSLLEYLKTEDEAVLSLSPFFGYANCLSDQDTENAKHQDMKAKALNTLIEIQSAAAFASPEIMAIPEETLKSFIEGCPALREYERSLYRIRRRSAHILSEECETLLAKAGELAETPEKVQSIFENADLKFDDVQDCNGDCHPLTNGSFVPLLESADRVLRKNTFEGYYKKLGNYKNTLAALLDSQFKQLNFFAKARKYNSTLEAALFENEVPTAVYHNLIAAIHENLDKMYRYVALRKQMLNVEDLHMYDVYTPIVKNAAREINYEEAKETVLDALSVLGGDYTALLREGFENRWIDVYENTGKRSGAYSTDVSRPHPYVLLNHKDNLESMFTLAHEMGHALHSYHSTANQPVSTSGYVIFVAEVASTCNEVLLMKYLLAKTDDKKEKSYLINHFLDQFKGTVFRQTMFAEFELEMGKAVENGNALTADFLCDKYMELNKKYFGADMVSDREIALEWARIPHFYYNYYVFQYATGFTAAVAIANRILTEGEKAVADYKQFLSSGSSTDPISLLKIAGVDMSSPNPVNEALALFSELIDSFEALQN